MLQTSSQKFLELTFYCSKTNILPKRIIDLWRFQILVKKCVIIRDFDELLIFIKYSLEIRVHYAQLSLQRFLYRIKRFSMHLQPTDLYQL